MCRTVHGNDISCVLWVSHQQPAFDLAVCEQCSFLWRCCVENTITEATKTNLVSIQ